MFVVQKTLSRIGKARRSGRLVPEKRTIQRGGQIYQATVWVDPTQEGLPAQYGFGFDEEQINGNRTARTVPTKQAAGNKNSTGFVYPKVLDRNSEIRALGRAKITHIGGENVYVEKDGQKYVFKPLGDPEERYNEGDYDFSNEDIYTVPKKSDDSKNAINKKPFEEMVFEDDRKLGDGPPRNTAETVRDVLNTDSGSAAKFAGSDKYDAIDKFQEDAARWAYDNDKIGTGMQILAEYGKVKGTYKPVETKPGTHNEPNRKPDISPLMQQRVDEHNKRWRYDGMTAEEYVRKNPDIYLQKVVTDDMDKWNRRYFNRLDSNKKQEEYESRLKKKHVEGWMGRKSERTFYIIPKTIYDYLALKFPDRVIEEGIG